MAQIIAVICIIIAGLGYYKYRFLLNPITAMFLIWGLILPFSDLGLFQVINPSNKVYVIILIGLIAYLAGVLISSSNVRYVIRKGKIDHTYKGNCRIEYEINYYLIYVLTAIAIVYYFVQLLAVIRLLLSGFDYSYIRSLNSMGEENTLFSSYIVYLVKVFIAVPTTYLTIALVPIELFFGKRKKTLLILSISLMVLFVLTTGGRSVILWIVIYFTCVFLMYKKKNKQFGFKIPKKIKRFLFIGLIGLGAFMLIMTKARKGSDVNLLQQVFIYYVAPITHFDHYIEVVDSYRLYGYGLASFYGLIYPVLFLLRFIGVFRDYPEIVSTMHYMSFEMMEKGTNIGGNIYMNAFVTIFYQPYLDGRIIGVILCLLLFGIMCGRSFTKAYYQDSLSSLLIYNLLLQKILCSVVRFYFTQQAQSLCFIIAFFAIRKIVIHKNEYSEDKSNDICDNSNIQ